MQYDIPVAALDQALVVSSHSAKRDKWYAKHQIDKEMKQIQELIKATQVLLLRQQPLLQVRILPVPGSLMNKTPFGILAPISVNFFGVFKI